MWTKNEILSSCLLTQDYCVFACVTGAIEKLENFLFLISNAPVTHAIKQSIVLKYWVVKVKLNLAQHDPTFLDELVGDWCCAQEAIFYQQAMMALQEMAVLNGFYVIYGFVKFFILSYW